MDMTAISRRCISSVTNLILKLNRSLTAEKHLSIVFRLPYVLQNMPGGPCTKPASCPIRPCRAAQSPSWAGSRAPCPDAWASCAFSCSIGAFLGRKQSSLPRPAASRQFPLEQYAESPNMCPEPRGAPGARLCERQRVSRVPVGHDDGDDPEVSDDQCMLPDGVLPVASAAIDVFLDIPVERVPVRA